MYRVANTCNDHMEGHRHHFTSKPLQLICGSLFGGSQQRGVVGMQQTHASRLDSYVPASVTVYREYKMQMTGSGSY